MHVVMIMGMAIMIVVGSMGINQAVERRVNTQSNQTQSTIAKIHLLVRSDRICVGSKTKRNNAKGPEFTRNRKVKVPSIRKFVNQALNQVREFLLFCGN